MLTPRTGLARRAMTALDASPSRIPVLVGGCGSGRTTLLQQLHDRIGRTSAQYIDVERTATTPERFLRAIVTSSPDEFLELRTFESFPGLRRVLHEFIEAIAASGNRLVITSRYVARTMRLLRGRSARFEIIHMPPLTAEDTLDMLGLAGAPGDRHEAEHLARTVQTLADGRPAYVSAIADELADMREHGGGDPISALASLLAPGGRLTKQCGFSYELRLHRARGYGALKAILEIVAEEEGLTLTEISQRLQRTPGSTKDYLSWLEDVDLVIGRSKRYSFIDPLLRVWVRLHCHASPPTEEEVASEMHRFALPRLPQHEPALAMATAG